MLTTLLLTLALVAVATGAGLLWRALDGRRRRGSGRLVRPADVALEPGAFGDEGTLLQFSTEWCARCPATRRLLGEVAGRTPGVRHADVDLTDRPELATRFDVLQTPTVLVLDARGAEVARFSGAPRAADVDELLAGLRPAGLAEARS
ncbi:thioredoxin family protein [Amnibacterium endophyticum]|uniref:Thioredoxin family protein n=1 Tax=Amnibacterium endophyticum TaxID=2109337 RepID=A0ABW4LL13_9MICO